MKKLLAMLGAAGLVVSTSAVLVSCGGDKDSVDDSIVNLTFTLGENNKDQTVKLGELKDVKVSVEVKTEEKAEGEAVATATLDEKTNIITVKALAEGKVTYLVKTTPVEPEKEEEFEEGEGTTPVEPTLIKTINIEVKPEATNVNYEALNKAIKDAQDKVKDVVKSVDGSDVAKDKLWATEEALNAINTAITDAQALLTNTDQTVVDEGVTALTTATTEFTPVNGTQEESTNVNYEALNKAIKDAQDKVKDVIKSVDGSDVAKDKLWATEEALNAINTAITDAQALLTNTDQTVVDEGVTALTTATTEFTPVNGTQEDNGEGGEEGGEETFAFYYQA